MLVQRIKDYIRRRQRLVSCYRVCSTLNNARFSYTHNVTTTTHSFMDNTNIYTGAGVASFKSIVTPGYPSLQAGDIFLKPVLYSYSTDNNLQSGDVNRAGTNVDTGSFGTNCSTTTTHREEAHSDPSNNTLAVKKTPKRKQVCEQSVYK